MPTLDSKNFHADVVMRLALVGHHERPLLAPRGAWLVGETLIVSDTGQNRVLIWNELPKRGDAPPDVVLGQSSLNGAGRNAKQSANASTLQYPSGVWSDGKKLIVADAWNHRVLVWHTFPTRHAQPADVVLGQKDFTGNTPNLDGVGSAPTRRSLYWCYGVFSDGKRLWIADSGNRRTLYFETIPDANFADADAVIGKSSFTERDSSAHDAVWPYSVKVSLNGALAIADTQYSRVLIWRQWQDAFHRPADVIIGQPDLDSSGANQFYTTPQRHTLNLCYDAYFYEQGLLIADTANSRILVYDQMPDSNNAVASSVIGQPDFETGGEKAVMNADRGLYWAFSAMVDNNRLLVTDTGNHRVILCDLVRALDPTSKS